MTDFGNGILWPKKRLRLCITPSDTISHQKDHFFICSFRDGKIFNELESPMNNNYFPSLFELALEYFSQQFPLISAQSFSCLKLYCVHVSLKFCFSRITTFHWPDLATDSFFNIFTRLKERNLLDDMIIRLIFRPLVNFTSKSFVNTLPLNTLDLSDIPFLSDKSISQYDVNCNLASNSSCCTDISNF
jgi:hypothetical protein